MGFLNDFLYYGSGHECPEPFMTWSGLSLLSAVAGRKIWTMHGDYFPVYTNLYVCMVGSPASGKSTALDQAETIFIKNFPLYLISESIQSREDILKKMTNDECLMTKTMADGTILDWRPFYCLVDEMENFVSVGDKQGKNNMVAMLVGIYSRSSFGTGFKNDKNLNQRIQNPFLSLLGCTVPEWMMSNLRMSIFTGGLGRRLIIVHCEKKKQIEEPKRPTGHMECMLRMVEHLKRVENHIGELKKTPAAQKYWKEWYHDPKRKNKEDPILIQFHENGHIPGLKVATLLALSENPEAKFIEDIHLQGANHLIQSLDGDIVRLTSGIGRNELAGVGAQLKEFITRMGGGVPEVMVKKHFHRFLHKPEFIELVEHYRETGELVVGEAKDEQGNLRRFYFTPEGYVEYEKKRSAAGMSGPGVSPS